MIAAYREGLQRYADFSGRTGWSGYLGFLAVNLLIGMGMRLLEFVSGQGFFALVGLAYGLAVLIPGLAITVRRVRDAVA